MDPKAGVLLSIPEFKGMATNAPRGTVLAPTLLLNVHLDRTGGYSPMYARSQRLSSVARSLSAGVGDDLFVELGAPEQTRYWDAGTGVLGDVHTFPLDHAVLVMPGVLLSADGSAWLTPNGLQAGTLAPGSVADTGTPDLKWAYVSTDAPAPDRLDGSKTYQIAVEWLPTRTKPYRGVTLIDVGAGHGSPPAFFWVDLTLQDIADPAQFNVYLREDGKPFRFYGSNSLEGRGGSRPLAGNVTIKGQTPPLDAGLFVIGTGMQFILRPAPDIPSSAAYHQGRAYIAPWKITYDRVAESDKDVLGGGKATVTEDTPRRLFFSEVTADGTEQLPAFSLINYVDVPFKVSRRIVALASVGPYLYIFGDRELLILTGDPSTDARIESIGDSIGAVSAGSVQQLGGTVFWLSDSGVMAAQGAQVREVGADVRDLILALGAEISSTIDFKREVYYLSDGQTILAYHAREGGWTLRAKETEDTLALGSGGGTAYMTQTQPRLAVGALFSIGGEADLNGVRPPFLTMTIRWPTYELGSWLARKTFRGIACGLDLESETATVLNQSSVDRDVTCDTSVTVTPTNTGVRLHTSRDGVNMTGVGIAVRLQVSTQDPRGILRPPLAIHGSMTGEEAWTDGR